MCMSIPEMKNMTISKSTPAGKGPRGSCKHIAFSYELEDYSRQKPYDISDTLYR